MILTALAMLLAMPDAAKADYSAADSYLDYLLADDVLTSGEFRMTFNALGLERTCELLRPNYAKAMAELTPAWRQLYKDMVAAGIEDPGPLMAKSQIRPDQRQVLLGLGLKGNELIGSQAEAIKNALVDEALKVPDDSIDYQKREKEMGEAVAKDVADCGLLQTLGDQ